MLYGKPRRNELAVVTALTKPACSLLEYRREEKDAGGAIETYSLRIYNPTVSIGPFWKYHSRKGEWKYCEAYSD